MSPVASGSARARFDLDALGWETAELLADLTSAEGRVERATDQTRRYSEQLWGLPRGSVTSDLWCREVRLEGCAPCRGRIPGSSGRTWSGSPATVSLVSGHGEVVGHHPAGGFALEFPVAGSITTPAQGGDRVRTRSLRRRRRQPDVDAEVAAVPWCSGSAPRRRPRTRRAPTRTTGDDEAEFEEAAAPSRGRGRRRAQPAGPAHRRGGEPGRRVPGVPHRAPHALHARELTLRPPGGPPSRRRRRQGGPTPTLLPALHPVRQD